MANSKSAKKRVLVAERNRVRNQAVKTRVKTMAKKVLATLEVKDVEAAKTALSVAYKEFDLGRIIYWATTLLYVK